MLIYVTVRKIACEIWRNEKHWTQTLQLSPSVGFHRGSWVIGQPQFFLGARILSTSSLLSVQLFKFVIIFHKSRSWRCFSLVLLRQTCSPWVLKGHCSKLRVCFIHFFDYPEMMFVKWCSWNTTPWLREQMFLSKPPILTSASYLSWSDLWHFSKRINGNNPGTAISSCVLTDPPALSIFPRPLYILDSSCPCRLTWARTEFICMCSSSFSVVSSFWEATLEPCVYHMWQEATFVTFMLVTNSWINFFVCC